jgi:outer membrane receptor protein involved in Fe transport
MKIRENLFATAAIAVVLGGASSALAQGAAPAESTVEEVVVTGSLVVRNGNEAPTPVTVVDTATLKQAAPTNIPDGLNQLPQFSGSRSQSQASQSGTAVSPSSGNYLNLRNLGFNRSLVLLDGARVAPTSYEGIVDTNILPNALIQRVDVVTAGASATYGSDAVTGVINFILDKKFTGLKGTVQVGVSEYGDNLNYRAEIAGGAAFANDRLHTLFSYEHFKSDGIKQKSDRPLYDIQPCAIGNGTTDPYTLYFGCRQNNANPGGVVLSGPFASQYFLADGSLARYDAGPVPSQGGLQVGGSGGLVTNSTLVGSLRTEQAFARVSYDFTDTLSGFVQAAFGESRNRYVHNGADNRFGNLTIFSGNAFLSAAQQAQLTATNTASFRFGRQGYEQGGKSVDILNDSLNVFAGFEGTVFGDWDWRATYSGGSSIMRAKHTRNPYTERYFAAIDAIRSPTTGQIVCRVTVTNPGRMDDCIPLNMLGPNRASKEAIEYAFGQDSQYDARNTQHDVAATISGTAFTLPAGDVNVAAGVEWRTSSLEMRSNADPAIPLNTTGLRGLPAGIGRFGNTNQGIASGEQDVTEAFGEVLVPLLKDVPFAQSLDFNGAFRVTDYATSGQVETWKAGLSYAPITDLRIRGTVSQDIRAPSLNELFGGVRLSTSAFTDIHTGVTFSLASESGGNPGLEPEVGKTTAIGFVYQPGWFQGFTASIDYYNIEIEGAIASRSNAQLVEDCENSNGTAPSCDLVTRPFPFSNRTPANAPTRIRAVPANLASAYTHGIDFDFGYRLPLSTFFEGEEGVLTFRSLANYSPSYKTLESPTSPIQQQAGVGNNPKWRVTSSVNYQQGPFRLNLQQRFIGEIDRSATLKYDSDIATTPSIFYYNLSASYKFTVMDRDLEGFANISNLFDKDPPIVARVNEAGLTYPTNQAVYDVIGRAYTVGIRFAF